MQATETTLLKVLAGTRVFQLPFFQRRYRWSGKNWEELWEDFLEQYDHPDVAAGVLPPNQGHFLGSIVLHPAAGPVSTVAKYLLVDGQQRITTLLALLAAFRDFRSQQDRTWNPAAYDDQFLKNPYSPDDPFRLVPTLKDRDAYRLTLHEGKATGQIGRAYRFFSREIRKLAKRDGHLDFVRFENALLLRMLVVEITTAPSDDVNHIFHTLNASGEALAPLDLVRNHAFMQVPDQTAEQIHQSWMEVESRLGEARMERYLWAQFVRTNPKASQRNLYNAFQLRLKSANVNSDQSMADAVAREVSDLRDEVELFEIIENPRAVDSYFPNFPAVLRRALYDLGEWRSLVHLPLTLELLSRWRRGVTDDGFVAESFGHIQSYLVRRALCGIPTNNLNRIFAGIPVLLGDRRDVSKSVATLLTSEQRYWPTDRQVRERVGTTPLRLGSRPEQVRFILSRLNGDESRNLEYRSSDEFTVHPVLPAKLTAEWRRYLVENDAQGPDEATTRAHVLGNLVLVATGSDMGGLSFEEVRDSAFPVSVNADVRSANVWNTEMVDHRSARLCEQAIRTWRRPGGTEGADLEDSSRLSEVLLEMPENKWTSIDALAEFLAERPEALMVELDQLEPVLAVKVLDVDGRLPTWLPESRRSALISELERGGYDPYGVVFADGELLEAVGLQDILQRESLDGAW